MYRLSGLMMALLLFISPLRAQWVSINPGAGGQVQDVVCDPSQKGTLYLASDMEGVYKTTDNGKHWHMTGKLVHNRVYSVAVSPQKSDHLFVGTLNGLQTSTDGGEHYQFVSQSYYKTYGAITVNPLNPQQIVAGFGWRDDYDFVHFFGQKKEGRPEILVSNDGGKSWNIQYLDQAELSDKNIWNIVFHPQRPQECYISTASGIYVSKDDLKTWTRLPSPDPTLVNRGLSISPNGKILYTVFANNDKNGFPYAMALAEGKWMKIATGRSLALKELQWWYPEVDPRSTGDVHQLILSLEGNRDGLFEGTIEWDGNELKTYDYNLIWQGTDGYDFGWDMADPNPRYVHYTPASWERAIWSTTNENMFEGVRMNDGTYQWNNKYCDPHYENMVTFKGKKYPTYSGRGTESTYTYDIVIDKNYVIQAQGDNGLMESWDYGKSWSNLAHRQDSMLNLSDVQAVAIAEINGQKAVVAQATGGYGGFAVDGKLYYKILNHYSPQDKWQFLGGGKDHVLGLPDGVYREINVDPQHPERLYAFSTNHGMYLIDNLSEAVNNPNYKAQKISNGIVDRVLTAKTISVDPNDENTLYFTGTSGLVGVYKGQKKGDQWKWERIYKGGNWESEVCAWDRQGKTMLVYEGQPCDLKQRGCDFVVELSEDGGENWKTVFTKAQAFALRADKNDAWYPVIKDDMVIQSKGGLMAYENRLLVNFYNHRHQNGIGLFMGTIHDDGTIDWEDISGDLHYLGVTSGRVYQRDGQDFYYISTPGAGAWYRPLPKRKLAGMK